MPNKSKFFRVGTEGDTTDGRVIERAWIEQMAASYNPATFGARINLEHIRGVLPEGPFKAYGDITALKAEIVDGKMTLMAQIDPTDDLVAMTKARQKVYTSMEIDPNFAKTGSAYLVGLAVTDNPASLGTDMLTFCAGAASNPLAGRKQRAENLFSQATPADLAFDADADHGEAGLLSTLLAFFKTQAAPPAAPPAPPATSPAASFPGDPSLVVMLSAMAKQAEQTMAAVTKLADEVKADRLALSQLRIDLSATPFGTTPLTHASGGAGTVLTDC